ncbi:hypothetical protein RIEGSTA812A_PEG_817 [invertebrate metagenome]|uniref:Uncharacterized protein n=1 Tax=invertebrate metagenome TaxID=1711999 RepID=A0A484H6V1_9ZZZZ
MRGLLIATSDTLTYRESYADGESLTQSQVSHLLHFFSHIAAPRVSGRDVDLCQCLGEEREGKLPLAP